MCGEIVNGTVLLDSIDSTFHQKKDFDGLDDNAKKEIINMAHQQFCNI